MEAVRAALSELSERLLQCRSNLNTHITALKLLQPAAPVVTTGVEALYRMRATMATASAQSGT